MIRPLLITVSFLTFLSACDMQQPSPADDASRRRLLETAASMAANGADEQALAVLLDAEKKFPRDPEVLKQLGYRLIAANQPLEAARIFDRLIDVTPNDALSYSAKAVALDHADKHAQAQELHRKALNISPETVSVINNYAMSLILDDQAEKALPILEDLKKRAPESKTVRQNLVMAYALTGQRNKALALASKDLTAKQAKENLRFYDEYAKKRKALQAPKSIPAATQDEVSATPESTPKELTPLIPTAPKEAE